MIIHQPELKIFQDQTIVFSRIEFDKPRENYPDFLWFKVPEMYEAYISLQSDSFLNIAMLAGMHFNENIEVRGSVSPNIAYNLNEIQYILSFWRPEIVSPIEIKFHSIAHPPTNAGTVGATFSGGVDSSFTLRQHLPENQIQKEYHITHALMIHGFNFYLSDQENFPKIKNHYQNLLSKYDIDLISIETNLVNAIVPHLDYVQFYGPVLTASVHMLGKLFNKFIIPNSNDHHMLSKNWMASNPISDKMLSTKNLEILHHGATHRRSEKIANIQNWEMAQKNLKVCGNHSPSSVIYNCSKCEKCVRTMIPLYAMGKIDSFTSFQNPIIKDWHILRYARWYRPNSFFIGETYSVIRNNKPRLLMWFWLAMGLGLLRYVLLKLVPHFLKKWLTRFGFYINQNHLENAFENPQIINLLSNNWTKNDYPST